MKKNLSRFALAALVAGVTLAAMPAHAVSYYDSYGRAYYYNTWGQPVYYDTGYRSSYGQDRGYTQTSYSASSMAQPVYSQPPMGQQDSGYGNYSTTYSSDSQPLMAATPAAMPMDNSQQTTYQYYYPDGSSASTTYVSQTSSQPYSSSSACRQSSRTEQQWGEIQTHYYTECQQPDGSWMEQ